MPDTQKCDHSAQPVRAGAADVDVCPFKVGETVAAIGVVVKIWPARDGMPVGVHIRFKNPVAGAAYFTPVPIDIVRRAREGEIP